MVAPPVGQPDQVGDVLVELEPQLAEGGKRLRAAGLPRQALFRPGQAVGRAPARRQQLGDVDPQVDIGRVEAERADPGGMRLIGPPACAARSRT